jgi:hypothetical protein
MKKILVLAIVALTVVTAAFAQPKAKVAKESVVSASVVATENAKVKVMKIKHKRGAKKIEAVAPAVVAPVKK